MPDCLADMTYKELIREVARCGNFRQTCDVAKANRYLEALDLLQVVTPDGQGKGTANTRVDTKKFDRLAARARTWLAGRGPIAIPVDTSQPRDEDGRHYSDDYERFS